MANSRNIGIDLGTSNVLIMQQERGVVLREAAVVAQEKSSGKVLAVGDEAWKLVGRTPGSMQAVRPLRQGAITDMALTSTMLQYFIKQVIGRRLMGKPRCVISVPSSISDREKRDVVSMLLDAGVGRTQLLERPIAAALGADLPFRDNWGCMIIDMGAGASDIAVLSGGETVVSSCVPHGGDYFDDAIIRYLRKKHNLLIGDRTAEEIKNSIGMAMEPMGDTAGIFMNISGRNLVTGLPRTQKIDAMEVYEALREPVNDFIEAIQSVLQHTPPQLATDVFEDGLVLSGGAAQLTGLAETISREIDIPCRVVNDPQACIVRGCAKALEDPDAMRDLLENGRRRLLGR